MGWVGLLGSESGLLAATTPQSTSAKAERLLGVKDATPLEKPFADLKKRLKDYFAGERVEFPDELDLTPATDFQSQVWRITRLIPYGETRSYGWIASRLGKKGARAVGQALARNRLPVIIPCHRVVRDDGSLGGYGGGVGIKKALLRLEDRG